MSETKLQKLKVKRQTLIAQQDRVKEFIEKKASTATFHELEIRLSCLEKYNSDFQSIQALIEELDSNESESSARAAYEELYFLLQPSLKTSISDCARQSESSAKNATLFNTTIGGSTVKLPKVPLPTFAGDYTKWLSYSETFSTLVDKNESIDEITKFHYLRASLSGQPLRLIESIDVSAKNYCEAIKLLQERYGKTTIIVEEHIKNILNFPSISKVTVQNIRELIDSVNVHLRSLASLGRPVAQWDDLIISIMMSKLDNSTNERWIDERVTERLPTLNELFKFLDKRCLQLEMKFSQRPNSLPTPAPHGAQLKTQKNSIMRSSYVSASRIKVCDYCSQNNHLIYRCRKYLTLIPKERFQAANEKNLCINCLKSDHSHQICAAEKCRTCQGNHHTLLHAYCYTNPNNSVKFQASEEKPTSSQALSAPNSCYTALKHPILAKRILLATALIKIMDKHGNLIICRALLDSGSQLHFITEALAQQLGMKRIKSTTDIGGIGTTVATARCTISTTIHSLTSPFSTELCFYVLPRISEVLPDYYINTSEWSLPADVELADPRFFEPSKIDILLGAEIYFDLLIAQQIRIGTDLPVLQNTQLGYIVSGVCRSNDSTPHLTSFLSIASLDKTLRQFWEIESHVTPVKSMTQEENLCELHFLETVKKSSSNRFVVRLPFRKPTPVLGNSLEAAKRRLISLERKFKRDPQFKQHYINFMTEYENLQHMRKVPKPVHAHFFLPHHAVLKLESSSTKTRVVFDASAKTSTNVSLNDTLMTGPTVQSDLFTVIVRFRSHRFVFTADVKQMYRQIEVDPLDRPFQMIVWRTDPLAEMSFYELNTVTYGTSAAPYLATRCLNQLALDEKDQFPSAAAAILKETYVDDIMTGASTLTDAHKLQSDLIQMLSKAHFDLRKFCSNDKALLSTVPKEYWEPYRTIGQTDVIKTLGLTWQPEADVFMFHISISEHPTITKRTVLSDVGKIFDPLGLIGPVVVLGKIFLQQLWKKQISWDEALSDEHQQKWSHYIQQLHLLSDLQIQRHLLSESEPKIIQLHSFSDSSESAYGACCYLRCEDSQGNTKIQMICSKSRVAPTKFTTLPRLELCAALLMAELVERLITILPVLIHDRYFYCDSKVALAWISKPSYMWQTFVANRVAKIQELTKPDEWRYVSSKDNPADIISRGALPEVLLKSTLWKTGPNFLMASPEQWPQKSTSEDLSDIPDLRHMKTAFVTTTNNRVDLFSTVLHRGSLQKLERIFAYCYRFCNNAKLPKSKRVFGPLSLFELDAALTGILRNNQRFYLQNEYKRLLIEEGVHKSSRLSSLNPFLDEMGLIRVGGRLHNALGTYDSKHQIILPKCELTKFLITFFHFMHMHAGPQTLLSITRQRYWPIDGKHLCRNIVHNCVRCFRVKPKKSELIMGALPKERVQPGRAFLTTGIDFCGPVWTTSRIRGRPLTKTYLCIFVCFSTKATHIEVVSDLSTEAFVGALRRFIARRGLCSAIFCDNATNFVGAKNLLAELYQLFQQQSHQNSIQELCQTYRIEWRPIPPRSPHFGGLWEAAVKTAKYHLIRVVAQSSLTFEELCTLAAQIEAILNSRPITPLSEDPADLNALTPGHFLIGAPLTSFPEPDISEISISRLSRFRRLQQLQQIFWKRWSTEYLHLLQQRYKWESKGTNLKPGTLVLIQDDTLPPLRWTLARVTETFPGSDGVHRVAQVKTQFGSFRRATAKLYPLPLDEFKYTSCTSRRPIC